MRKITFILLLLFSLPVMLFAQQKVIRGKVTSPTDGTPLPGVSVMVNGQPGSSAGSTTNEEGEFVISVPNDAKELVFTFVGRKQVVEKINGRSTIDVSLLSSEESLGEVVVVGYGSQRKETLTGSVATISAKEIQTTTHVSLAQKIQGKVPGLLVRQMGGEPGTFDNVINIRGFGTPLYVIDGIVRDGSSDFQRLNAEDIESISFLKDASAAIYGFGSANGVVIVTTRKGRKGRATFNYTGTVGFMQPTDVPRMTNASEWMQLRNDAALLGTGSAFVSEEELQKWITAAPGYESTDWYGLALKKTAVQQQHNLSASGGNEKTQYYIGLALVDEGSLLRTDDINYKRYNIRSNLTTELANNLKAELFIGGRFEERETPGENFFNIFKGTRTALPTERPFANNNPDYLTSPAPSNLNPLALSDRDITGYSEELTRSLQTTMSLIYTAPFLKGLSLRGTAAYDMGSYQAKSVYKPFKLYGYVNNDYVTFPQRVGTSSISNNFGNSNRFTVQAQVNYATSIATDHFVGGTAVFEQRQEWGRNAGLQRLYDFYTIDQVNAAGQNNQTNSGSEGESSSQSLLGRFNYDFRKKYFAEFAFRYMGTYAYPPETRWGFFPIVSAGWRISEEPFIQRNLPAVTNLKLKGSYGEVGDNTGVGAFQWIQGFTLGGGGRYEFTNGSLTNGAASPGIVNPSLTWVTAKTSNIGIELGLWNKLNLEFEVFRRDREGLLAFRNLSLTNTFGASLPQENLNSDRTQGFDFSASYRGNISGVQFNVAGNVSFSRTQNLYVERGPFTSSMDRWRNGTADRYNDIVWALTYLGQFMSEEEIASYPIQNGGQANIRELPGDFKFKDVNNDGVIDGKDQLPLFIGAVGNNDDVNAGGRKNPKINYGLTLSAVYKNFDVNILLQGSAMYTVRFSEVYAELLAFRGNTPAYFFDRWRKSDPYDPKSEWIPGKWPAARFIQDVGAMYNESSVWRKNASYVRLKNLEIGYTFGEKTFGRSGIKRLRIYANGFNLLTICDPFVKPFDPERLEGLYNAGFNYPLTKTYNFGVNLNF
ncbi:MAG: TonB-dependent receptor [Chitinophagaceae bacterium]